MSPQGFLGGNISVSSPITQLRELRDALCQSYPVCDVGAFFPPFKLGNEYEILGRTDPHHPYSSFNMLGSQQISQGFKPA